MTTDDVLDIGGGLGIDVRTLKGVIHDEAAFGNADPIVGALFRGDLDEADRLLDVASVTSRTRALRADVLRDRGQFDRAEEIYRELVGKTRTATLVQHLGKVLFAAEDFAGAEACFAEALAERAASGASEELLASSRLALRRALEEQAGEGRRRTIRIFPDWGHRWPLWENSTPENDVGYTMRPEHYGLSVELTDELRRWYDEWEQSARPGDTPFWVGNRGATYWRADGVRIAELVRTEVARFADVSFEVP